MKDVLNQTNYEKVEINDIVGLYKPIFGRQRIVSFLEPGCSYDKIKVKDKKEAMKILEKSCLEYGLDLFGLEANVQINWGVFAVHYPRIKGIPYFVVAIPNQELPSIS